MQLRPAQAKDAKVAGKLILSSAKNTLCSFFDVDAHHYALGFLQHAFKLKDGQYGHGNHWVIEVNAQVAAIVSAWHTELSTGFHHATLHSIASYYGLINGLDVIHRCQVLKDIIPPPKNHEWCIGHFAVAPEYQRKGLGKFLLSHMQTLAKENAKHRLSLDVELDNQGAITFYLDSGFTFSGTPSKSLANEQGIKAHGHMRLAI